MKQLGCGEMSHDVLRHGADSSGNDSGRGLLWAAAVAIQA